VRRFDFGKAEAHHGLGGACNSTRWAGSLLSLAFLAGLFVPYDVRAQTAAAKSSAGAAAVPADATPLGRYVAKDNLIVYIEFAGLDAHAASWQKTAAYKMLNDTPLGGMLEEVSTQLLDKALGFFPNRRLSGA
jgi:hypothetical protein